LHTDAVGKRTAQALSARETVEPGLERRIRKSAVVTRDQLVWHQYRRQAKRKGGCQTDESAHRVGAARLIYDAKVATHR
jgi:hypothetical protein